MKAFQGDDMKHAIFAAALTLGSAAMAQQVPVQDAQQILTEGRILSAVDVSGPARPGQTPEPTGTRTHEVFALHEGKLYLCYLIGSSTTGTAPRFNCHGS